MAEDKYREVRKVLNRFKEPSSWAGLASVAGLFGVSLDPSLGQHIALLGAGLAGVIAFFLPEK